jgi:hypothetical protein
MSGLSGRRGVLAVLVAGVLGAPTPALAEKVWRSDPPIRMMDPPPHISTYGAYHVGEIATFMANIDRSPQQGTPNPTGDLDYWEDMALPGWGWDPDDVWYTWEVTQGHFSNGQRRIQIENNQTVEWTAPDWPTPEVTVTLWVDDEPLPPEQERDDNALGPYHLTFAVVDVIIYKCPEAWMPYYGGTVPITVEILPDNGPTGYIKFYFSDDRSDEPGLCMNAGWQGSDEKDLQFPQQEGFLPPGGLQNGYIMTATPVRAAAAQVVSYDYGAYGNITARAVIPGREFTAHVAGDPNTWYVEIPRDDDDNHIADAWTHNAGNDTDDNETLPSGDGTPGDGFTRYQEYRGFMARIVLGGQEWEAHVRTSPGQKDAFVYDAINYGLGDYPNLGPVTHLLYSWQMNADRVVNFNRETAPGHPPKCVYLRADIGWDEGDYGHTYPDPPGVGTPNQMTYILLYTAEIDADGPDPGIWGDTDQEMLQTTIGHECAHYTNVQHHQQPAGCVMTIPAQWNPIPHTYHPGCQAQFRLH